MRLGDDVDMIRLCELPEQSTWGEDSENRHDFDKLIWKKRLAPRKIRLSGNLNGRKSCLRLANAIAENRCLCRRREQFR
jgi:hypothetical protein